MFTFRKIKFKNCSIPYKGKVHSSKMNEVGFTNKKINESEYEVKDKKSQRPADSMISFFMKHNVKQSQDNMLFIITYTCGTVIF